MASKSNKLTARTVSAISKPGVYGDGGGLWLQVSPTGAKSWILRYTIAGRARWMGLGGVDLVTLAEAREAARAGRKLARDGVDPIDRRRAAKQEAQSAVSFKDAADRYIKAHRPSWKNEKHADQWPATLETYAYPHFGHLPVSHIEVGHVLKAIEPIWSTKAETASRVRGRIEAVLDWATARNYRSGENPARWKGHLDKLLPPRKKLARTVHHAALPYPEIGDFMAALREQGGIGARALEFCILVAGRTGEIIGATWPEVDFDAKVWTIPGSRMKAGKDHKVPLSPRAIEILREMEKLSGAYIFPGLKKDRPLSNMALLATLKRMKRDDLTTHGFRSTFRDWAAERTNYPREVAEMALAHAIGDKVEAAYRRGDLFEKRRRLMQEWAKFCDRPSAKGSISSIGDAS